MNEKIRVLSIARKTMRVLLLLTKTFLLCLSVVAATAGAQSFPTGVVRIIVPSAPGGVTDPVARHLADHLSKKWKVPVVVEHKPGAGGVTAMQQLTKGPADGYTLVMANSGPLVFSPAMTNVGYETARDIAAVGSLVQFANVLIVNPAVPALSVPELIELARKKPGTLNFASSGQGQSQHLTGEMFKRMANVDIVHVPYKGTGPATTDLIGGQVQMMFGNIPAAAPFVRDGRLRALGVTGTKRSSAFPGVPTIAEAGVPNFNVTSYLVLVAPSKVPREVIRKINTDAEEAWTLPAGQQLLDSLYLTWMRQSPEEVDSFLAGESQRWTPLIKQANIKAE
ncbi:Bug family tripartite tricarboxylate transporter substrate binding protein [Variovorax sp. VNK109]|uniref:Bug family tripartite tricarboxylate transporter substrate binding protein n=1 Tax=Variovorax sp. VNK109 TaxID=3400919 RepID=UPI003C0BD995